MAIRKFISDPVHGSVSIPKFLLPIIEHPYFQRLRHIRQLGLTDYVYPGAIHTRFYHAIGAMHLMGEALKSLREKGHLIFEEEADGVLAAILLHDIGHGPFSHALEHFWFTDTGHEGISNRIITELNQEFDFRLTMASQIFQGKYPRKFLVQLINSQLDMDRLDYLQRDSFFTGVVEGAINSARLIKMLDIVDNKLVVDFRAIYSVENFLNARRLMYWQVYLHKTSLVCEQMLLTMLNRARFLAQKGEPIEVPTHLKPFIFQTPSIQEGNTKDWLQAYCKLDDHDVWSAIKMWTLSKDPVLAHLSESLLYRRLFRIHVQDSPFEQEIIDKTIAKTVKTLKVGKEDAMWLVFWGSVTNEAYKGDDKAIQMLKKDGSLQDLAEAGDLPMVEALGNRVEKYYLCHYKGLSL